jgi:hypothetical protein
MPWKKTGYLAVNRVHKRKKRVKKPTLLSDVHFSTIWDDNEALSTLSRNILNKEAKLFPLPSNSYLYNDPDFLRTPGMR